VTPEAAAPPRVAIVLPPGEGFGPDAVGAIGLLVHRLAVAGSGRFAPVVVGAPQSRPVFADVPFHPAPLPRFLPLPWRQRYTIGVARALAALRPALIEVHNRPDLALALARRLPRVPVTLTLHNDPQGMRGLAAPAARARLLARLARVVAVSAWVAGRLTEGVPPETIAATPPSVLPNCLDLAALPLPLPAGAREKLILFAGRLVADKGADSFVQACAAALPRLPGWRAEMIGADRSRPESPETPFIRALRPRAAEAGIALPGYRPHAAVLEAMARAAIVVVPSRWAEPFGLTALEALACGAALVCSRRGGLPEIAGDAAVYVDPEQPDAMATALAALATNEARRATLTARGMARARRFDVGPAAAALERLRERVVGALCGPR